MMRHTIMKMLIAATSIMRLAHSGQTEREIDRRQRFDCQTGILYNKFTRSSYRLFWHVTILEGVSHYRVVKSLYACTHLLYHCWRLICHYIVRDYIL